MQCRQASGTLANCPVPVMASSAATTPWGVWVSLAAARTASVAGQAMSSRTASWRSSAAPRGVRSRAAGVDYLYDFVAGFPRIEALAVEHATTPEEADRLVERLGMLFRKEDIYKSTVSPVIGTYVGPHVLSVSVLEGGKE